MFTIFLVSMIKTTEVNSSKSSKQHRCQLLCNFLFIFAIFTSIINSKLQKLIIFIVTFFFCPLRKSKHKTQRAKNCKNCIIEAIFTHFQFFPHLFNHLENNFLLCYFTEKYWKLKTVKRVCLEIFQVLKKHHKNINRFSRVRFRVRVNNFHFLTDNEQMFLTKLPYVWRVCNLHAA